MSKAKPHPLATLSTPDEDPAELEAFIATMPEQYYWVHKRFKTRPEGEPGVY